jgi:hypothetical protein
LDVVLDAVPPDAPEPDDDAEGVATVALVAEELESARGVDPFEEVELAPAADCRLEVRAASSWATFLMSPATVVCADEAAASAPAQVVGVVVVAGGPADGFTPGPGAVAVVVVPPDVGTVLVVLVVVVAAQRAVACWRAAPAAEESASSLV